MDVSRAKGGAEAAREAQAGEAIYRFLRWESGYGCIPIAARASVRANGNLSMNRNNVLLSIQRMRYK